MEEKSFETNLKYFSGGIMPGYLDDGDIKPSYEEQLKSPENTLLKILNDGEIVGGAMVNDKGEGLREIDVFFIAKEHLGKGICSKALALVEDYFPDTKVWHLITPSQVMKNIVFYINNCGYHIVKVVDFDKEKEYGFYLFEKTK